MRLHSIISSLVLSIGLSFSAYTQESENPDKFDYNFWKDSTGLTPLSAEELEAEAIIINDFHIKSFVYNSYFDEYSDQFIPNVLHEENLYYQRIRLNNDAAIESYNKVYISNRGGRKVTNLKARAITKDGKIIEFDDSNKKEIENYENLGPFTIFALEGIEVGSEIEFTYTIIEPKLDDIYFRKVVQSNYTKKNVHFEIVAPSNFIFHTKSYNGLPQLVQDTSETENNRYVLATKEVEKFKDEKYSLGDALIQKVEAKLFENTDKNKRNYYSYNNAATDYANYVYSPKDAGKSKKELKAIKKLIKTEKFNKISNTRDQIVNIEHYIKSNFQFSDQGKYFANDVIETKQYTPFSAVRITALICKALDIDHQVVITSDRFVNTFDPDFETYNYLGTFLIYFPKLDQFIDPTNAFMRLGLIPSNYAYTKGLFLKTIDIGGVMSAFPEIKDIPGTNADVNYDNLVVDLSLNEDLDKVNAHLLHRVNGYSAAHLRPFMTLVDADKKKAILEDRLKQIGEDAIITNIKTENETMNGYMLGKPYLFEGDAEVNSLLENAGNKILLKVGQIIGPQVEMYQDKNRKFGVENVYNHGYNRQINITIPDGYHVTNLGDLNMDYSSSDEKKKTMEFTSKYVLEGNKLNITCNEYYNAIRLPVEQYEEFRTVINAAADFNKITLVLEKK